MKLPKEPYRPKQVTAFKAARKLGADESEARLAGHKPDNPIPTDDPERLPRWARRRRAPNQD